jgi:hypothetical protein
MLQYGNLPTTKNGLEPSGKVNLSRPARRVEVASILILLSSVKAKYPGDASRKYNNVELAFNA